MSDVDAIPAVFHGHVVLVTDLHTKSHRSRLMVELFRLLVDLLAVVDKIRPSIGHQHGELTRIVRRGYAHHTSLNGDHPIFLLAENEERSSLSSPMPPSRSAATAAADSASSCDCSNSSDSHSAVIVGRSDIVMVVVVVIFSSVGSVFVAPPRRDFTVLDFVDVVVNIVKICRLLSL